MPEITFPKKGILVQILSLGTALGCFSKHFFLIFHRRPTMVTHIFTQPPASTITKLPTALLLEVIWIGWFHFLLLVADPLVILISCMIFLSPFLYAMRMSMSTVSFPSQLHVIHVAVSLEVISTFCFWVLTKQLSYMLFIFTFVFFLVTPCFVVAFQPCMAWIPFFLNAFLF